MSGITGHVTRKDGRIVELPERVQKIFKWLVGASLLLPVIMLLVSLGDTNAAMGIGWAIFALLPVAIVLVGIVAILRQGVNGIGVFAGVLVTASYFALTIAPQMESTLENIITRLIPFAIVAVGLYFLKLDLHYNLRPLWYSMQAMKDMQEMMMKARAKKEAKKRGEEFDDSKFMDADAIIRAVQDRTGQSLPKHMQGITTRPGFRNQSASKPGGGGGKKKK